MTSFDELISSVSVLANAWKKYRNCINTDLEHSVNMFYKVDIESKYSNWSKNQGEVRFSSEGICIYNMDTDEELFNLKFNTDDSPYTYFDTKYDRMDIWNNEALVLRFGDSWSSDYVYYENGIITSCNGEELQKEDLESLLFQHSTVEEKSYSIHILNEHIRLYDYAIEELTKCGASYIGGYSNFNGYNSICQQITQIFK